MIRIASSPRALFKFASNPYEGVEVDTTSSSGEFRELSPFILPAPPAKNLENLWQFSKVYKCHLDRIDNPSPDWFAWRNEGWNNPKAIRYPMGKWKIPVYSYWKGAKLNYIEARKVIYAPFYAENVKKTDSFKQLKELYESGKTVILRDYDAYDHEKFGMTLKDVINNPNWKMGHAFVLIMMLTGVLEECLQIATGQAVEKGPDYKKGIRKLL